MDASYALRENESLALNNSQIISHVSGKNKKFSSNKKMKSFGAVGFLTAMIILVVVLLGSGNIVPSAISERLIEETDVQRADAIESEKLVFQQALLDDKIPIPKNTTRRLKEQGVLVGYLDEGQFIESSEHTGETVLNVGGRIVTAENFVLEASSDSVLYSAFNKATYGRAAYYYDKEAEEVFREIGTTRNNYSKNKSFEEVMSSLMGKGSDVEINSVSLVEEEKENGEKTYVYRENGESASSKDEARVFVEEARIKNFASTSEEAALKTADGLKVADATAKEQKSSIFFLGFMETISKMKAGEGSTSKINEAMNFLHKKEEVEVVDTSTGEIIKVKGSALDSPSLFSLLSGNKIEPTAVKNFSSDRVLSIVENITGRKDSETIIKGTVASSGSKVKGAIGRLDQGGITGNQEALSPVIPIVSDSLNNNSYEDIKGITAGEYLVEGAINVGRMLAKKSGATAGDEEAITKYAKLTDSVLAMDKKAERLTKSPFDPSSKNTFLGALIYNLLPLIKNNNFSILSNTSNLIDSTKGALLSLLPSSVAESGEGYLSVFGDNCKTLSSIGAVGSAQCLEIATFDPSTLNDPFNDPGFINFVNNNTSLSASGVRTINQGSVLGNFILYNNERKTPLGIMDGGILTSLSSGSNSIPFSTDIANMVELLENSSDEAKNIATGKSFLNSSSNPEWQTYKYAQRYVSLARATAALRQYDGDETAYQNIQFFEGNENPVVAFLEEYYKIANKSY